MSDLSPYLRNSDDGRIWWPLEDAIKLGAGYSLVRNGPSRLCAPDNTAKANERSLLGPFHDERLPILRPEVVERDGSHFVEAAEFLVWLSQYIAQTPESAAFPIDLARAVSESERGQPKCSSAPAPFRSLFEDLGGWFERRLVELPKQLGERVARSFFRMQWDVLSADGRRSVAQQWDHAHDPARESERADAWAAVLRREEIEREILGWETAATPTATDLAKKEERLAGLRRELDGMDKPSWRLMPTDDARQTLKCVPVRSHQIIWHFVVTTAQGNAAWWDTRMRNCGRKTNGDASLKSCRATTGRGNQPSYWRPCEVAGWLVDKGHMAESDAADVLRAHFSQCPRCLDVADRLSPMP